MNMQKWSKKMRKISHYMMIMEQSKFMEPKFSHTLRPLQAFLKSQMDGDSNSTTTSFSLQMMMNDSFAPVIAPDSSHTVDNGLLLHSRNMSLMNAGFKNALHS